MQFRTEANATEICCIERKGNILGSYNM